MNKTTSKTTSTKRKKWIVFGMSLWMAASLAACGSGSQQGTSVSGSASQTASESASQTSSGSATGTASESSSSISDTNSEAVSNSSYTSSVSSSSAEIPNPFTEVDSMEEAAKITGFDMTVPEAPGAYPKMTIQVMDNSMIEVIFSSQEDEATGDVDEGYRVRKAAGEDDISGDSNNYSDIRTEKIGNYDVTLKGNGDAVSVAIWNADGYSYAVDAEDHPMSVEDMSAVIEEIL